jgi:hypothetical protein
MGVRLLAASAATLFLCGCEVYAVPSPLPCPGERKGVFDFAGDQVLDPNDCFFAQPGNAAYQVNNSIAFQGTVSFGPGASEANLCVSRPHAEPRVGTHSGVDIDVTYVNLTGSVGGCTCPDQRAADAGKCIACQATSGPQVTGCSCPVIISERIQGALLPIPGGFSGFDGSQKVSVTPPPGLVLPDPPCNCQATCFYAYTLTAKTVGAR